MQKSHVVFRLFIPVNEDASKAVQPTMSPFYHPPSSLFASFVFDFLRLLATRTNMFSKTKPLQNVPDLLIIIARVGVCLVNGSSKEAKLPCVDSKQCYPKKCRNRSTGLLATCLYHRLGLMNFSNRSERLWWPLRPLRFASNRPC